MAIPRLRFNTRNVLLATSIAAIWCAIYASPMEAWHVAEKDVQDGLAARYGLIAGLPILSLGTLFGRPLLGAATGLALAAAYIAMKIIESV